jgi:hypothetical protein
MSNRPNLFATSFFQKIEDGEKKKSTWNATREKIGGTKRPKILATWWALLSPMWAQLP